MNRFNTLSVTSVNSAFTVNFAKGRTSLICDRSYYGLSFCLEGLITYHHNGKTYVSDPGCVLVLPKEASYTITGDRGGLFPVINFQCTDSFFTDEFIKIPTTTTENLVVEYNALRQALLSGNRFRAISCFYSLLDMLLSGKQQQNRVLQPAIEYIETHFQTGEIANETLAELLGISQVYLRRLFSENLGLTPRQYILHRRIQEAQRLLVENNLSVTQIADCCGFGSVYDFSRCFKNRVGVSPQLYRQTHLGL